MSRCVIRSTVAVTLWSLQALSAAYWIVSYQYADDDAGLAVRLARACLERGACPAAGTPTSGLGLSHGASWIRLIRYCLQTGGGLATVQLIIVALLIAATIVSSLTTWQAISWRAGMFASLLVLPASMATLRFDDLTNGTLLPLPLALYYACTAWTVRSGGLLAALGASVWLAASVSASLSCVLLLPFHLALVALAARKPLSAMTGAALAFAGTFAIESSAAAAQLAQLLFTPALVAFGLLVAVAVAKPGRTLLRRVVASAQQWRSGLLDMPEPVRLRAAMKLAALYLITAAWMGPTIAGGIRIPDAHFFAPVVFPLVFLAADGTQSMSDRAAVGLIAIVVLALGPLLFAPLAVVVGSVLCVVIGGAAFLFCLARVLQSGGRFRSELEARSSHRVAIAGATFVCLMSMPDALIYPRIRQVWPVATVETLVRGLYDAGFTFPQLMGALQGQAPYSIQSMIATFDPNLFRDPSPPGDPTVSLLAMIVEPALAARTHDVVLRLETPDRRAAITIRSTSVLDLPHLQTCYARSCDEPVDPRRCTTRDPHGTVQHDRPYFPVDKVETPAAGGVFGDQEPGTIYCVRFLIPLRMSGTGEPHWLRVPLLWPLDARIRNVTGVAFAGVVPGPEVRLSNDRVERGTVEVDLSAHGLGPESDWLEQPPLIEVSSPNEHLLEPFRQGRMTLR